MPETISYNPQQESEEDVLAEQERKKQSEALATEIFVLQRQLETLTELIGIKQKLLLLLNSPQEKPKPVAEAKVSDAFQVITFDYPKMMKDRQWFKDRKFSEGAINRLKRNGITPDNVFDFTDEELRGKNQIGERTIAQVRALREKRIAPEPKYFKRILECCCRF